MKITIAIDSFKGSLSSMEAGKAAEEGIQRVFPEADVSVRPLADGGEGTVEALICGMGGEEHTVTVTGPAGKPVLCTYGIIGTNNKLAVIEMAGAAGLPQLKEEEKNPYYTTTYGVGEVIRDAIKKGCRRFLIGIGGSATNDGGAGMLQALGFGLLDARGNQIPFGAIGLKELSAIKNDEALPELKECTFRIACDVANPLCGEQGCSAVFGPQKGATPEMIPRMDRWLSDYAGLCKKQYPNADAKKSGTGAAGGIGFAFLTFLNAFLESGVSLVLEETEFVEYAAEADLVITGEGRLDGQTAMGKAPIGVAKAAKALGKPVIAFAGSIAPDAAVCNQEGIDAFFPILRRVETLEDAMNPQNAYRNLADASEQAMRLLKLKMKN